MQTILDFLLNHTPLLYWTQSLWRDEAFSVWIAQDGIIEAIKRTGGDFNPPLYYIFLYLWMQVFGRSEIALRGLSVFIFMIFLIIVYKFALTVFHDKKSAVYTVLLMACNPMLLYFAFELRMYSLFILWALLSMYALAISNWKLYIFSSTLGMYTQPFMALVILAQCVYLSFSSRIKTASRNLFLIGMLYLPWIPTLIKQFQASGPMWMYPVDMNLVTSVLGNLYIGYEGTPGNLWGMMQILSLFIFSAAVWVWRSPKYRPFTLLLLLWISIPLLLVLGISFIKPVYVHRYVIFVTVAEVFLLAGFFMKMTPLKFRWWLAGGWLMLTFITNFFAVSFHRKVAIRDTFNAILPRLQENDLVYAATPLVFYESLYYAKFPSQVFLYNPQRITPPRYVGLIGMPSSRWADDIPQFPRQAYLISEDGTYQIVTKSSFVPLSGMITALCAASTSNN